MHIISQNKAYQLDMKIKKTDEELAKNISDFPLWFLPFFNNIKSFRGELSDRKVLILGAGNGGVGDYLSRCGAVVYAVDISISPAWKEVDTVFFLCGNNEDLPFLDNSFDVVISCSTFQYVDHDKVLSEVYRVSKNGASLLFNENLPNNPIIKIYRLKRQFSSFFNKDVDEYVSTINKYLTVHDVGKDGFHVEECQYYYFISSINYFFIKYEGIYFFDFISGFLLKLDSFLLSKVVFLRKFCWFCTYKIRVMK